MSPRLPRPSPKRVTDMRDGSRQVLLAGRCVKVGRVFLRWERDADGAVIASFDDHTVVRGLVASLVADAGERTVGLTVRKTWVRAQPPQTGWRQ
jgi:hypothetical protein